MSKLSSANMHGKCITYGKIKKLPERRAYLDPVLYDIVSRKIKANEPILFMPNDVHEMHLQDKKYEKASYRIILFGVLLDGRTATVVLNGITPFFEVVLKETDSADAINKRLSQLKYGAPESYEIVSGKQFKLYREKKQRFARFYFKKLKFRREAIKYIRSQGYETTADDLSSYYRVVCRDYLTTFSAWTVLTKYTLREYASIRGPTYNVNIKDYAVCKDDVMSNPLLAKDNTMTMCWDIETYSPDGQLPRPKYPDHRMFMIGITFQWHHASEALLKICLVTNPAASKPGYTTAICGTEKKLIKAFGKLVFKMKPEIILGFNDADYDWPWLIERAKSHDGLLSFLAACFDRTVHWKNYDDKDIYSYNYKLEKVKLEADMDAEGRTLKFPGYINIDVRTAFRQIYPTAEKSSLNFFLKKNKLQGKKDMPYKEMFRIEGELTDLIKSGRFTVAEHILYDEECEIYMNSYLPLFCKSIVKKYMKNSYTELVDLMGEVAEYCVIDSQRCHDLMKIRSVLMDRRGIAHKSYTSVYDAFFRANGMKVRNIVIARGQTRGLRFSNITGVNTVGEGKYPGGHVVPPKKRLVTSKLRMDERQKLSSSMDRYAEWGQVSNGELKSYYKVIEKYGAYLDRDGIKSVIKDFESNDIKLRKCFIDFLKEEIERPITGLDFASLYPSLIMAYNLSPEYIITSKSQAKSGACSRS